MTDPTLHSIPLPDWPALTVKARPWQRGAWLVGFLRRADGGKGHKMLDQTAEWLGPGAWALNRWAPTSIPRFVPPAALAAVEAWLLEQRNG